MPRNEIVERMALQCRRHDVDPVLRGKTWAELGVPPEEREIYYQEALELLAIVEENCSRLRFPTPEGVDRYVVANDELVDAFQLAREAREREEKK